MGRLKSANDKLDDVVERAKLCGKLDERARILGAIATADIDEHLKLAIMKMIEEPGGDDLKQ